MYPDRRGRPSDPRAASNRNLRLYRDPWERRDFLSQAASLLTPASTAAPSTQSVSQRQGIPWQHDSAGPSVQQGSSSSFHREQFKIFQPQVSRQRSRSVSVPRKSKKRKLQLWEHCFCCLASTTQCSPPGPMDRGRLMQAGLGGKTLSFMESIDAEDLHHDLLEAFPKLRAGGGYELLRTSERNNHTLDVIPPPLSGYTVAYLKSVARQAKIYVRPLQKDLDLTPTLGEDTVRLITIPAHVW